MEQRQCQQNSGGRVRSGGRCWYNAQYCVCVAQDPSLNTTAMTQRPQHLHWTPPFIFGNTRGPIQVKPAHHTRDPTAATTVQPAAHSLNHREAEPKCQAKEEQLGIKPIRQHSRHTTHNT
ncbi:hypothetical protein E2C01_025388 [Portunus trituberculatus]|uniref:Uncharacterized protein n=1 Tax=Portunus trituberculatus TaxID=210409 RepID=A0A5B7EHT1_PORTR|nr:hypothetical protein [Portunus trituberculatus]